jgi:DNA-binding winged helix-turn-helix (wHTH) protein/Flp pilus assembly protein TadD
VRRDLEKSPSENINRSQVFSIVGISLNMNRLLSFGSYRLDTVSRVLTLDAQLVSLPSKAIDVLLVLVKRRGEVILKDDLMKDVWPDSFVEEGNLTQHIHLLRRALQDKTDEPRYIRTVPGRGYSFVAAVEEIQEGLTPSEPQPEIPNHLDPNGADVEINSVLDQSPRDLRRLGKRQALVAVSLILVIAVGIAEMLPSLARHFNNKGVELQGKGELHAAINEYRRALLLRPYYAEARYNLADAYEEIPDYEKAIEEYQKAIDSDVTLYAAYNNLARLYILQRRDPGEALRLIDRALKSNPDETSVLYSLIKNSGWASFELHSYTQAEQDLRQAIQLQPNRGAAHCLLAKLLRAEGKDTKAKPDWASCLGYSSQSEVEPEWHNEALEQLSKEEATK